MKNEVIIDGVKLTRAQVEKALKDLNTPIIFENLTRVVSRHDRRVEGVVVIGEAQQRYIRATLLNSSMCEATKYTVFQTHGGAASYVDVETLLKDWRTIQETCS
jgi:hypothetical protein